jgi:hypothetical protein
MFGFKTGSLSQLFLPRSLQSETNRGKSNPQLPLQKEGRVESPRQGRDRSTEREKLSQKLGGRRTKTPFPDGRSRKGKDFVDFFNARDAATKPNTMWLSKIHITIPRRPRRFSSV